VYRESLDDNEDIKFLFSVDWFNVSNLYINFVGLYTYIIILQCKIVKHRRTSRNKWYFYKARCVHIYRYLEFRKSSFILTRSSGGGRYGLMPFDLRSNCTEACKENNPIEGTILETRICGSWGKGNYPEIFAVLVIEEIWLTCVAVFLVGIEAPQRQEVLLEVEKRSVLTDRIARWARSF